MILPQRALIEPDWPAPAGVRAIVTTRDGGISRPPYAALNLGDHVGDRPTAVTENRRRLRLSLGLRREPFWLRQVHGVEVVAAHQTMAGREADAAWSDRPGLACTVLTADCLPVLLCDRYGQRVAAAHAGWRGLAAGVLERTVAAMQRPPRRLLAWLGPAIGPAHFEVGDEVRAAFLAWDRGARSAFVPSPRGRWLADLYALARLRLTALGLDAVYGGGFCTYSDPRFYSYRRDGRTGRFASLIWINNA